MPLLLLEGPFEPGAHVGEDGALCDKQYFLDGSVNVDALEEQMHMVLHLHIAMRQRSRDTAERRPRSGKHPAARMARPLQA